MKRTKPPFRADHVGSLLRPAALKAGARAARQGRDRRRRPQGGRGPRDRARHQEAGGGRACGDHRRRVPPLLVASRLPVGPGRRRALRDGAGHRVSGPADPGGRRAHRRQGRLLQPSDARAFQVREGAHQAHAEDHDPGAVGALWPHRPRGGERAGLSVARPVLQRARRRLRQGGARLRRCRLPLSAARRSVHRHAVRPQLPQDASRDAATIRKSSPSATPT